MPISIVKRFSSFCFCLFLLLFSVFISGGELFGGTENPSLDYTDGTVVSLSKDKIVISEYNFDKDESEEATYFIDPNADTKDRAIFEKLSAGDEIEIYFYLKREKKIAQVVSKEAKLEEKELNQPADPEAEDDFPAPVLQGSVEGLTK